MAKPSKHSFTKFQKELKRKKKAKEKLDRRQGKKDQATDADKLQFADRTPGYTSIVVSLSQLSLHNTAEIADEPQSHDFHPYFAL